MRLLQILFVSALMMPAFQGNAQATISGVTLPATMKVKGTELVLNGGGIRKKLWIELYVGGLYIGEKSTDAKKIIEADEMMAMKLSITSKLITSDKMIEAVDEGFEKSTGGNTAPISSKIQLFKSAFSDAIVEKDVFDIVYIPGKGTSVFKNNNYVKTVSGLDFKQALWGIWLGDEPADDGLKTGMLGG